MPRKHFNFEQSESIHAEPNKILSTDEIKEDVDVIQIAMKKAYIGSHYLPENNFLELTKKIKALTLLNETTSKDFCNQLGKVFDFALDNHLSVEINNEHWRSRPLKFCAIQGLF